MTDVLSPTLRLQASRARIVQQLSEPPTARPQDADQALAAQLLQAAAGMPGADPMASVWAWAGAKAEHTLAAPVRAHPALAMGVAFVFGAGVAALRPWRWRLPPSWALALLSQVATPWLLQRLQPGPPPPTPPPEESRHAPPPA